MQNRALYACQRVLTLSLGVGSMLNVLSASGLTQIGTEAQVDTEVAETKISKQATRHEPVRRLPLEQTPAQLALPEELVRSTPDSFSSTISVEGATPRLSTSPYQQAVCLIERTRAIKLEAQADLNALEALTAESAREQSLLEEISGENAQIGVELLEESKVAATPQGLESATPKALISGAVASEETALEALAVPVTISDAPNLALGSLIPSGLLIPSGHSNERVVAQTDPALDDDLGTIRLRQTRSRGDDELGNLRLLQTTQAPPPPPKPPIAFIGGRLGFLDTDNAFRSERAIEDQIYQTGLTLYLFPKLSEKTSLYAIAEGTFARYDIDFNEIEVQAGIRHRLFRTTFVQIGWRNQKLFTPGYREKLLGVNYLDALVSHRKVLSNRAWVDGFYQLRLGFADPTSASRFNQSLLTSINYAPTSKSRTSLLYQLELDDYLKIDRYDISHQFLGVFSYNITPQSKLSLFGGTRFGSSSAPGVNLDDIFYGVGFNVSVPLF